MTSKVGEIAKDFQYKGLPLRLDEVLVVVFSNASSSELNGKVGFGFVIWFNGSFVAACSLDES